MEDNGGGERNRSGERDGLCYIERDNKALPNPWRESETMLDREADNICQIKTSHRFHGTNGGK